LIKSNQMGSDFWFWWLIAVYLSVQGLDYCTRVGPPVFLHVLRM